MIPLSKLSDRVLTHAFADAVQKFPQRTFLQFGDRSVTYSEVDQITDRVAAGLAEAGLRPNGKLAIMSRNCLEFVFAWLGAAKAGIVYVPINVDYVGQVLTWQLGRADVTHIVIGDEFLPALAHVQDTLPLLHRVFVIGGPTTGTAGKVHTSSFDALLHCAGPVPRPTIRHTDPLAISFTSGTTGPSKGVLASHCHVLTFARDWLRAVEFPDGGSIYTPLPLFHAIAAWLGVIPALMVGGRIAITDRFSASNYWSDAIRFDVDVVHGIFSMIPMLLKQPAKATDGQQRARRFYIGRSEPEFERRFKCKAVEVFGSTETGIVTMTPPGLPAPAGSCGKANDDTFEVIVADENDQAVGPGVIGEILVRPRHPFGMFTSYYGAADATAEAYRNQWFHTGDNAKVDADGWFYFVDRKKDAIRRRGENISSYEVESVLLRLDAVLECAAVAAKSELGEDEVKVVVVVKPGEQLAPEEIWTFCEENMPRFWVPRFIEFRSELPKTPNHKVQKHLLRDTGGQGLAVHERPQPSRNVSAQTIKEKS